MNELPRWIERIAKITNLWQKIYRTHCDMRGGPFMVHTLSAIEIVLREGRGSLSLLQRALGIGYGRAARLIDLMAEDGIVGRLQRQQRP